MKNFFCIIISLNISLAAIAQKQAAFKFQKIIYRTSGCFGSCPEYQLQLDNKKKLKVHAEKMYVAGSEPARDKEKEGYFTGVISTKKLQEISNTLASSGLDTVTYFGPPCCDVPQKTIIIYYNNKRKVIKTLFPPASIEKMVKEMEKLMLNAELKRTSKPFRIEDPDEK
jgi:hypothetical protein